MFKRKNLKYVQTVKGYHYFRKDGQPRMRLPAAPLDSEEFLAVYLAALRLSGEKPQSSQPGSIGALVAEFKASAAFREYSEGYRNMLARHYGEICAKAGDALARDLRGDHIASDLSKLPVAEANRRRKAWAALCGFGKVTGRLKTNPAEGVTLGRKLPPSDGHEPWLAEHIDKFRSCYRIGTPTRLVFEILHWTGARISDGVLLGDRMIGPDGVLSYRQEKTGEPAYVPWSNPLPDFAEGCAADRAFMFRALDARPQRHFTFMATAYGKTRSDKAVGNFVAEAARAVGINRTAHGLRKTRAIALAEGGASTLQTMAWTGHLTMKEIERYTRKFARRKAVMKAQL